MPMEVLVRICEWINFAGPAGTATTSLYDPTSLLLGRKHSPGHDALWSTHGVSKAPIRLARLRFIWLTDASITTTVAMLRSDARTAALRTLIVTPIHHAEAVASSAACVSVLLPFLESLATLEVPMPSRNITQKALCHAIGSIRTLRRLAVDGRLEGQDGGVLLTRKNLVKMLEAGSRSKGESGLRVLIFYRFRLTDRHNDIALPSLQDLQELRLTHVTDIDGGGFAAIVVALGHADLVTVDSSTTQRLGSAINAMLSDHVETLRTLVFAQHAAVADHAAWVALRDWLVDLVPKCENLERIQIGSWTILTPEILRLLGFQAVELAVDLTAVTSEYYLPSFASFTAQLCAMLADPSTIIRELWLVGLTDATMRAAFTVRRSERAA